MKPNLKYRLIEQSANKYPIQEMCAFFGVSRSGYYRYRKHGNEPDKDTLPAEAIAQCQQEHGKIHGYRYVHLWWITDISYIPTAEGFLYLTVIRDLFDNSIVAYQTGRQQTVTLVLDTIRAAMAKETVAGKLHLHLHSDQGLQSPPGHILTCPKNTALRRPRQDVGTLTTTL